MNPREAHVGKSFPQKQGYWRYISEQDYEPTVDEKLPFNQTTESGEELRESSGRRRSGIALRTRLIDHLSENWFNWLVGAVAVILLWLMFDSKNAISIINERISSLKESIASIKAVVDSNTNAEHQNDLQINENRLKIEFLQKQIDRK
jgi:hypothetical protein